MGSVATDEFGRTGPVVEQRQLPEVVARTETGEHRRALSNLDPAIEDDVESDPLLAPLDHEGVLRDVAHLGVAREELQLTVLQTREERGFSEPGRDRFLVVPRHLGHRRREPPAR